MSTFSSANVTDGNLLLKERTHTINNKIQLHILGVPPNKLGNWLIKNNAFSVAGPVAWNSLPSDIRTASTLSAFKNRLKTHLFLQSYYVLSS